MHLCHNTTKALLQQGFCLIKVHNYSITSFAALSILLKNGVQSSVAK